MSFRTLSYMVFGNMAERKGRTLAAVLVIAFAVAVVTAVSALNLGFLHGIGQKAEDAFPPGMLLVKPRTMNVAILSFNTGLITDKTAETIRQMPGVEYAARQLSLRMPMRIQGEIMGQSAETDAFAVGIDPVVVEHEIAPGLKFRYDPNTTQPMPGVLPHLFIDMYNLAYADSMGLPKINDTFPIAKEFDVHLGETYLLGDGGSGRKQTVHGKIVGLTNNPSLMSGLLVPLDYANLLNQWYTGKPPRTYTALHVKVRDVKHLDQITSRIQDMGLISQGNREELRKIHLIVNSATLLGSVFAIVILAIAIVAVVNMFSLIMTQRRGEVGLLRAVGGTRNLVTRIYVLEVALISFAGCVLGFILSAAILKALEAHILRILPKISLIPEHIFHIPVWLPLLIVLLAATLCIAATFPIIYRTTRLAPVRLIAED